MNNGNKNTDKPVHCGNCGRENPEVSDGYTQCCNEPRCYGERNGMAHDRNCPKGKK